jgi:hypothetical protein
VGKYYANEFQEIFLWLFWSGYICFMIYGLDGVGEICKFYFWVFKGIFRIFRICLESPRIYQEFSELFQNCSEIFENCSE